MKKSAILAAAAVLAATFAGPAMAQEVVSNPGYCAQFYPNANCQNKGPGNPYTGSYQRQVYGDQGLPGPWLPGPHMAKQLQPLGRQRGFWPGNVAAGVVGGAVGTAAAIATAPFVSDDYARRNGFVCTPGTLFRGEDGRTHICQ